ncbi:MAG TPA: D-cysteine desulfhydrase family protein, partial [Lacipirellulaceae bacterium]|nr:D-cysteine desulfhydrase family protein [Lacipirellulaceae bacterium]
MPRENHSLLWLTPSTVICRNIKPSIAVRVSFCLLPFLAMLSRFPRIALCHRPTPLEALDRLSEFLGGPRVFVKRDDCTGLALGGNKVRKLEFLLGEALAAGADTLVTTGGVQSNHCRQTAAAAARLGLGCELVLPHVSRFASPTYDTGGNVLLDQLLGAKLHFTPDAASAAARCSEVVETIRARGGRPYFIPTGGSTPVGALGYVDAAGELAEQARAAGLRFDYAVVTTGSCTTHAGLVVGFATAEHHRTLDRAPQVLGVSVYQRLPAVLETVRQKAHDTAALVGWDALGISPAALAERVNVNDDYLG